jgi:hypothetical protein
MMKGANMRFWSREIAGWLLVGLGLFAFYLCTVLLFNQAETADGIRRPAPRIFEAGPMMVIGIFVFRGGIHLLKVAVAAQVCLAARDQRTPAQAPSPSKSHLGPRTLRPTLGGQKLP